MMGEVPLRRVEELLLGVAREPRPTLAIGNPAWLIVDRGQCVLEYCGYRRAKYPLFDHFAGRPTWPR